MKLANDPRVDYKDLVRISYNQCARAYNEARHNQEPALLELIANKLPPYSEILDIGCGTGVPITKALAAQHKVVGVDFSEEQIKLARANVPEADFICRDITESKFRRQVSTESSHSILSFTFQERVKKMSSPASANGLSRADTCWQH